MSEGEVGKVGGSRKKLFAGIVVVVIVVAGIVVSLKIIKEGEGYTSPSQEIEILMDVIDSNEAWLVKVVKITPNTENTFNIPEDTIEYRLNHFTIEYRLNHTTGLQSGIYQETIALDMIKYTQSPMGVMWIDVNNNSFLEVDDYFYINKSGGINGKVNPYDYFQLMQKVGTNPRIYGGLCIPPADFLNMSVEETSDGWNMTVTYVNGTIPVEFLEAWNVSFRLENKSGEFLTSYRNDYSFWLGFIRFPLPEYNHVDQGFYNITWYDYDENRIISLNDTFVIYNYSSLVEADYTLRLMSNRYGSGHTMIEVVLV